MSRAHFSDDRLIELCLASPFAPPDEPHLLACDACEGRRAALAATLTDVSARIAQEADELFPAERLARQHARILQQIDHSGRPARVIAFPAGYAQEPIRPSRRRSPRWLAAAGAVAAAFIVGILAEHLAHELPGNRRSVPDSRLAARAVEAAAPIRTVVAPRTVVASLSDDEFLGQIELAVGSAGPAMLRPLDALTPRAWDVR
jgi:hypothetical protein